MDALKIEKSAEVMAAKAKAKKEAQETKQAEKEQAKVAAKSLITVNLHLPCGRNVPTRTTQSASVASLRTLAGAHFPDMKQKEIQKLSLSLNNREEITLHPRKSLQFFGIVDCTIVSVRTGGRGGMGKKSSSLRNPRLLWLSVW